MSTTLGPLQQDSVSGLQYSIRLSAPAKPARCLVLLHGVGSNEANMLALANGVSDDTLVVTVRGPLVLGPGQFAWFRVAFTASGPRIVPEEAEHSRLALIALVQQLQAAHGIAANKTVVAGFSQGGIMSASVALSAPQVVEGFGLLSGRILPELRPHISSKVQLANLQAFVAHGELDSKLPVDWAHKSHELLDELGVKHALQLYPVDHTISAQMHADFLHWLASLP
jgi:phospholipase/carboxylesterase